MNQNKTQSILDDVYSKMKINSMTKTRSLRFGDKIANQNEVIEAYDILEKLSSVYDSRNGKVIGFDDGIVLEFSNYIYKTLSQNMQESIKEMLGEIEERGSFIKEEITAFLIALFQFDAIHMKEKDYQNAKEEIFNFIVDNLNKNDENITRELDAGLYIFLQESKKRIKKGPIKFNNNPYTIDFEHEKRMDRANLISEMYRYGILDYNCLTIGGEVENLTFEEIEECFRKKGVFNREDLINILLDGNHFKSESEIIDYYSEHDKKYFLSIANTEEIVRAIINGKFDQNDSRKGIDKATAVKKIRNSELVSLPADILEALFSMENLPRNSFVETRGKNENYIDKDVMSKLSREALMRLLLSKTVKYKNPLSSVELIDQYGKMQLEDLVKLYENGIVFPEDIIKVTKFFDTIEEDYIEKKKVAEFYTLDRLEEILNSNKLNKKFVDNFNNYIENVLTKEDKEEYFNKLSSQIEKKGNGIELLINFIQKGIDFKNTNNLQISIDKIEELYFEEKIDEKDIIEFYRRGIITVNTLNSVLSYEELEENYKRGELDYSVLSLIPKNEKILIDDFQSGKLSLKQLLEIYSMSDQMTVNELEKVLEGLDITEMELGTLLPDFINPQKVEELFKNYIISHDELDSLVERGIINKELAEKYAKDLATHEAYEGIFNSSNVAVLTRETEPGQSTPKGIPTRRGEKPKFKIDPFLQETLLDEIGFDERRLVLKGYNNTLDGYQVFPSEKNGVVVFINLDKPSNATYIMSLQQALFFIKNIERNSKTVESTATKKELRETKFVKVRNASRKWGKNIVDSIRSISIPFEKEYHDDKKYKENIDEIINEIQKNYDYRRENR